MALPCRFSAARSSLEASSSSLHAFSSRSKEGCALGSQRDRQPLSDLLADELGQRCDIARANAALPQGLALLAERFHRRLRSLSCRSCARFSISFQSCMSTSDFFSTARLCSCAAALRLLPSSRSSGRQSRLPPPSYDQLARDIDSPSPYERE